MWAIYDVNRDRWVGRETCRGYEIPTFGSFEEAKHAARRDFLMWPATGADFREVPDTFQTIRTPDIR